MQHICNRNLYFILMNQLRFVFFLILFSVSISAHSQAVSNNLSNVKVDELSEDQLRQFVIELIQMGIRDEEIEEFALLKGMNRLELGKLTSKIQATRKELTPSSNNNRTYLKPSDKNTVTADSISLMEKRPVQDFSYLFDMLKVPNFGSDVFRNPRITFEPNLRISTPGSYQLGPDDELLIDVSGYSEASYRLKITNEGVIRIPQVGPLLVSGLTLDEAKKIITKKFASTIYSNIRTGKTQVSVSVGDIRTIKITIIGEAVVPGTYTLPSLASAYHALYACGGPNSNGSFRNIQIIRNNKVISTIDVYQFLVNGTKANDIRLMDDDIVKINSYGVRIELKGEIKKPGQYDVVPGETLAQIISYAGNYTSNAYTDKIQAYKNTTRERKIITLTEKEINESIPAPGDVYIVEKILNRFGNRVSIRGAISRPGEYELKDSMTLSQLIKEADGLRPDAFMSRGTIHRLRKDLSPEMLSFDAEKILNQESFDIRLQMEDQVYVYSKFDLKEGYYVTIEGEIARPGVYLYEIGMNVQDLILLAGGLKEASSLKRIEIARRIREGDGPPLEPNSVQTAIVMQQDVRMDLKDNADFSFSKYNLNPFDEVSVRTAPGYFVQKNVVIEGEVQFTGKYTLQGKNEKISDLVKRSGGITPEAYLKGAVLVRSRNLTNSEKSNSQHGISNLIKQNYQSGASEAILQNQLATAINRPSENVGIDLEKILEYPGSEYDLLLNDGDTLRIPKLLQTVRVNGEILYPNLVRYNKNYKFKDYILEAGGFTDRASKRRTYVVNANGTSKGTPSFFFFRKYPRIGPGADIYVPMKRERIRLNTLEVVTVSSAVATLAAILYNIIKK
jgi:protein involved in polysaccharide export with SLBB domain